MNTMRYSRDWGLIRMTYREAYDEGRKRIVSDEADIECAIILEYVMGTDRNDLFAHPERELIKEEEEKFFSLINRRNSGEPVQYITGKTFFYGLEFLCDNAVLIPRFDTEVLVEEIIKNAPKDAKLLDLCTGSGCIALSVKHERNDLCVFASDISKAALATAKKNKENLSLDVTFIESDMFENIEGRFDVIVSNPPYIPKEVIEGLDEKVKKYEPYNALCGGEDGLNYYRIIADKAKGYLNADASLMMEIGFDQGESVSSLLRENGYTEIKVIKDLNGLDRVVTAVLKG